MTADDLRARAAERRRVGWELSDVMTPTEMENLAKMLEQASQVVGDATADMGRAIAAEREACARVATGMSSGDCDERGVVDRETGDVLCGREDRGDVCLCAERNELVFKIADKIRARSA